jgi:hypothetical protein
LESGSHIYIYTYIIYIYCIYAAASMMNHSVIGFDWHKKWMWILAATSGATVKWLGGRALVVSIFSMNGEPRTQGATIRLTTIDHRIEVAS